MKALPALLEKYHLAVLDVDDVADVAKAPVKFHRVALYQSWRANMDEGWTRYVLDDMSIPYKTIHNDDIKGTKDKKPDLRADFDVIVFADESANVIKGTPPGGGRGAGAEPATARRPEPKMPPEYEGGIGPEGVANLKTFVEMGGILITLNNASELAMNDLEAPARNVLQGVDRTRFFCPTSILKILVDNETPIGYGMPKETAAMFANCPAFETLMPPYDWDRKVVVAVGIPVTRHPPHRSVRALLAHTAPTSDVWRQTSLAGKGEVYGGGA
ncbi:MAG: hypothetical protein LAP85_28935, partial [Acidobacteriia bacterium]|nr:hypothetical protein [Terriglobia bacterium]